MGIIDFFKWLFVERRERRMFVKEMKKNGKLVEKIKLNPRSTYSIYSHNNHRVIIHDNDGDLVSIEKEAAKK